MWRKNANATSEFEATGWRGDKGCGFNLGHQWAPTNEVVHFNIKPIHFANFGSFGGSIILNPHTKKVLYIYTYQSCSALPASPAPKKKRGSDKSSRMEASCPYNILILYHTSNIWIIGWLLNPIAINKLSHTHPMCIWRLHYIIPYTSIYYSWWMLGKNRLTWCHKMWRPRQHGINLVESRQTVSWLCKWWLNGGYPNSWMVFFMDNINGWFGATPMVNLRNQYGSVMYSQVTSPQGIQLPSGKLT